MRIAIGSDHRGFVIKSKVIELLKRLNQDVFDVGPHSPESVDYPDIAGVVLGQF
jgi:ribose 5-phosphate isomerase B